MSLGAHAPCPANDQQRLARAAAFGHLQAVEQQLIRGTRALVDFLALKFAAIV